MKPVYLLCYLLCCSLLSAAQTKTEIAYWGPRHNLSSKLIKYQATVTIWKDSLPAEVREYHGSKLRTLTLYNAIGQPVDMQEYIGRDTPYVSNHIVYAYNDAGLKISETAHVAPPGTPKVRNYSYNRQGQLEKVSYSYINKGDRKVDVIEAYSYDEKNNLFRKTIKESRSPYTAVWQYEYGTDEDNNKKVKEFFTVKRKLRLDKSYTYDTAGRLIREYERERGGGGAIVRTYEYTLDAQGDWTKKKIYEQRSIYPKKFVGEYRKSRQE